MFATKTSPLLLSTALWAILFMHRVSYLCSFLNIIAYFLIPTTVYSACYMILCHVLLIDLNFENVETKDPFLLFIFPISYICYH